MRLGGLEGRGWKGRTGDNGVGGSELRADRVLGTALAFVILAPCFDERIFARRAFTILDRAPEGAVRSVSHMRQKV